MLQVTPQTRILVALNPVDFRRGIDGLAAVCRSVLKENPFSGTFFVFRSRSGKSLRVLAYDGQGYWLCTKRLSSGTFRHWPTGSDSASTQSESLSLLSHELTVLLFGGDPKQTKAAAQWRPAQSSSPAGI